MITIVIPCYNAERWLGRALESVLAQTHHVDEVFVVDDGSTDRSREIALTFPFVKFLSSRAKGACAARNTGAQNSGSDYVLFLDADDYLEPNHVESLMIAAKVKAAQVVVGGSISEWPDGQRSDPRGYAPGATREFIAQEILSGNVVQTGAVLWRADFLDRIGGWDENVLRGQDEELFLRALRHNPEIAICSNASLIWRHEESANRITKNKSEQAFRSHVDWHLRLLDHPFCGDPNFRLVLAKKLYALSRRAFESGFQQVGIESLSSARSLGLRGHYGSKLHILSASCLGLSQKAAFGRWIKERFWR